MNFYEKLADIAVTMEKLFQHLEKEKNIEKRNLYLSLLEDYRKKEEYLLETMTKEELEECIKILNEKFGFTFDGIFFFKIIENNHLPLPILRVYHHLFHIKSFYNLQKMSVLKRTEAIRLDYSLYVKKILKKDELIGTLENHILLNLISLSEENRYFYLYLYYSFEMDPKIFNQNQLFVLEENPMLEDIFPLLYKDIFSLTNTILKEKEDKKLKAALKLLQAFLIAIPEDYHEYIIEGIKHEQEKILENKEIIISLNLMYLNQLLKSFSLSLEITSPEDIEETEIENNQYNYKMAEIKKYEKYYFEILDITKMLVSVWIQIIESKRKNEPKRNRIDWLEMFEKYAKRLDKYFQEIPDFIEFQEYIALVYSLEYIDNPYYYLKRASLFPTPKTKEDQEMFQNITNEFTIQLILKAFIENQYDFSNKLRAFLATKEEEKEEEKSIYISRLESGMKLLLQYLKEEISKESCIEGLEDLEFAPKTEESNPYNEALLTYYKNELQRFLKANPNSPYYKDFYYALQLELLFEEDFDYLIKHDFERTETINIPVDIEEEAAGDLEITVCDIIEFTKMDKKSDIWFSIYLEALKYLFDENRINLIKSFYKEIKEQQKLERKYPEKNS